MGSGLDGADGALELYGRVAQRHQHLHTDELASHGAGSASHPAGGRVDSGLGLLCSLRVVRAIPAARVG